MTDSADHPIVVVSDGDLTAEFLREAEIKRGTPTAGEVHDVVVGHVQATDGQ